MDLKYPKFNPDNLYEVKTYTDIVLGSITQHIPIEVHAPGVGLPVRSVLKQETFTGNTVLHTTNGPLNISFPIIAASLYEAVSKFDESLKTAIEEMQSRSLRNKIITGGGGLNNKNKPS